MGTASMKLQRRYPVVIAGAGPVGLCAAIELTRRGVACLVVEKGDGRNDHPRANVVGPRSMEHFRRWGIAEDVIAAGLPMDYPTDVVFTTRLFGHEITRFAFPSIAECRRGSAELLEAYPAIAHSPYFKTAVGQNHLEPVLRRTLRSLAGADLVMGCELTSLSQDADGVRCELSVDGQHMAVDADYLVACDGAKSTVRQRLEVPMEGRPSLGQSVGVYIRAPGLVQRFGRGGAILYWTMAPGCAGVFIAIDGRQEWVYQRHLLDGESPDAFDARRAVSEALGAPFDFDVLTVQPWVPRQLVARTYRAGRVFLAGDAAHLLSPTGGFGMNTGIGDAVDIGWKLAAVIQGWGGPVLLDSYELERRPIAWRNATEATDNRVHIQSAAAPPPEIEDDGAAGQSLRSQWADRLLQQRKHFAAVGIHLGYRYDPSPLVVPDGTPAPPDDPMHYRPVARPGSRAPHVWLAPGESILDRFGPGFTLLHLAAPGGANRSTALAEEATRMGLPLSIVDIDHEPARAAYGATWVLVRPDGHVAWRADGLPDDCAALLRTVCGREAMP